ncbi:sigma 54-interacting transcriptional regulator [Chitinophaga sp. 30R24]|uniref:sigma-54-dependent Fis family transcriptional regulator n=1 Tax=Chitinophaga sp. 30R24 TaxID=3248838 RepID=UPI003B910C8B
METGKESEILLSLSRRLAEVHNREGFLQVVKLLMKKLFSFNDLAISVIGEDRKTRTNFIQYSEPKRRQHAAFKHAVTHHYPLNDLVYSTIKQSDDPVIFKVSELLKQADAPGYASFYQEAGIKELIGMALRNGNDFIGGLFIATEQAQAVLHNNLELFKEISYQVSIAVVNILSEEKVKRQEAQKDLLLSLSNEIVSVRNKQDLLKVINEKLRKLFAFRHSAIGIINEEQQSVNAFIWSDASKVIRYSDIVRTLKTDVPVSNAVFREALSTDIPVVVDLDDWAVQEKDIPLFVTLNHNIGNKEMVVAPLRNQQKNIGVLLIFSEEKHFFTAEILNLIRGICFQITIAMLNVLANEQLERKERETAGLLKLSNAIASIRNKKDLLNVIYNDLKKIISFNDIVITVTCPDNLHHKAFLYYSLRERSVQPEYIAAAAKESPIEDGIYNVTLASQYPVVWDIEEVMKWEVIPSYIQFWHSNNIKRMVGAVLRNNSESIGGLYLFSEDEYSFSKEQLDLIAGISYQISIAVANILANEEIITREKEKTSLLSLSNDIAAIRSNKDIVQFINAAFKQLFSFTHGLVICISDDKQSANVFAEIPDSKNGIAVSAIPVIQDKVNFTALPSQIVRLTVKDLPSLKAYYTPDTKNVIISPLYNEQQTIGAIILLADQESSFDENLLKGVAAQLSIAMINILANEKIESQLSEINRYKQQLEEENTYLQEEIQYNYNYGEIIGESVEMHRIFRLISQVSFSDSTVLLLGETGTGKELIARAIHNSSQRKDKLLVKVNCAALPANLIESELFGHEKGSFTGAIERRIGKFELANNGTLFLDEIGELPLELQGKLLRAIQEKEIERIGGKNIIKIDIRIITATNRNLLKEVQAGIFRSDLYYRLAVFPVVVPPLRDRPEDIPLLVNHFVERFNRKLGKQIKGVSAKVMKMLQAYHWPGNVRELEHQLERSMLLANGTIISEMNLSAGELSEQSVGEVEGRIKTIDENERDYIIAILRKTKGQIGGAGGAASLLGVPPSTLNSKIKKLGIVKEENYKYK